MKVMLNRIFASAPVLAVVLASGFFMLAPTPAWAPVIPIIPEQHPIPAPSQTFWNEFGEDGGKCPGACGSGCPDSCKVEPFKRCHPTHANVPVSGESYTCGSHAACSALEDCQGGCANPSLAGNDALGRLLGIRPAHAPVIPVPPGEQPDFEAGQCSLACQNQARRAGGMGIAGSQAAAGWALGMGPYDDAATWEYTTEQPGGEVLKPCGPCEKCENGDCVADPEACPNGEPPPEPPPPLPPPVSTGDVHLTTLDGLRYDFQAVGEFIVFEDAAGEIALQIRTRAMGNTISVTSAVAMRVAGDRIGFYTEPQFRLLANGQTVELPDKGIFVMGGGGEVHRFGSTYFVRYPGGSTVAVRNDTSNFGIFAEILPDEFGTMRGLAGNNNGDVSDDLVTRDGTSLPAQPSFEQLYDELGNSWRIQQHESLFDYLPGESTATFTFPELPERRLKLSDLDPDAVRAAEQACAAISHPRIYRDCVFDVAVTGDTRFVQTHADSVPPVAELAPGYFAGVATGKLEIDAPASAKAGSDIALSWSGQRMAGDFVAVARDASASHEYLTYRTVGNDNELLLPAPATPGNYSLRYIQGNAIAAEQPLEVTEADALLQAAQEAYSGGELLVTWTGPGNRGDYVSIATPEQPGDRQKSYKNASQGSPLTLRVPDEPGRYELRYIQGQSRNILTSKALTVLPVEATLEADSEAKSGGELLVTWTGPGNRGDYISIATPEQPGDRQKSYKNASQGSPLTLRVPDEPGSYELRYIQGQSRNVLASKALTVLPVEATLEADSEAKSGGELLVTWTGPGNRGDYISIATPEQPGDRQKSYKNASQGSPLTLRVPDEPGRYELRYIQGQSRNVLTSKALTVLPVEATLEADSEAKSGGELLVTWTGPGNRGDYISIATPEQPGDRQKSYENASQGSPLTLRVPDEPGRYELRYIQGQSRNVLTSKALTVLPVEATLEADSEAKSGGELLVTWTGPGNRGDYISIATPEQPGDRQKSYQNASQGSPLTLRVPDEPGRYELRYVQGQSRNVLQRKPLVVKPD